MSWRPLWGVLVVSVLFLVSPRRAEAQAVGSEFQVNTTTTGDQKTPAVSMDEAGDFVVGWTSGPQYDTDIFAQRFDAAGTPQGEEFQVNTRPGFYIGYPAAGMDGPGNFVVVWDGFGPEGVSAQLYDAGGTALGSEFQVSTSAPAAYRASVSRGSTGEFIVTWTSVSQDGDTSGVFGQRFDSDGIRVGSDFQVNTYTASYQDFSAVRRDGAGNFVVVWASDGQDGSSYGIFGQRFDADANPQGAEFPVNTYTTGLQLWPSLGVDKAGNFVVAWQSSGQDGDSGGIFGQRFDAAGNPLGPEFQVNTYTPFNQGRPSVGTDAHGGFVVVWYSYGQDGDLGGIFGQRYDSTGAPLGSEFRVNSTTAGGQSWGSVAMNPSGNFVVVWTSSGQDGDGSGVFGQRYAFGPSRISDFDGDSRTDLTVYHPPSGRWSSRQTSTGTDLVLRYGGAAFEPVPGDYDGDGRNDIAVYHRPSAYWFVRASTTGATSRRQLGAPGYAPVPRDYDGDGRTDIAVYHEASGRWSVRESSTGLTSSRRYGGRGFSPVPADYDGDARADIAVYHRSSGWWFVRQSTTGTTSRSNIRSRAADHYGRARWRPNHASRGKAFAPVPRDYDGDSRADIAVYHERSGRWSVRESSTGRTVRQRLGGVGFAPVPAEYDGDGLADIGVYRRSDGRWFVRQSRTGTTSVRSYGGAALDPVNR